MYVICAVNFVLVFDIPICKLANLGSVSRTQPDEIIVEFEAGQSTSQENTTWQHEEIGLDTGESDGLNKRLKMSHPSSTIETDKPDVDVDSAQIVVAKGRITRFAQPRYRMFETRDMYTPSTEYGRGIADFDFRDLTSSISRFVNFVAGDKSIFI